MTTVNGGTITYTLRGTDVNLAQTLAKASSQAQMLAGKLGQVTLTVQSTSQAMARQQAVMLATAQAQARLATATGNHSQAANILKNALSQVNNQTVQSINAQTQLTNVQKAAANGVTSLTGKIKDLAKEVGIFGALFIGKQVAGFVGDLISGANDLEKVKAKVQALSRTEEEYASTIKLASDQQKIFGGSLTENLDSLGAFLNLSQRTGVKLKDLENVARRLAIIDPIQGRK